MKISTFFLVLDLHSITFWKASATWYVFASYDTQTDSFMLNWYCFVDLWIGTVVEQLELSYEKLIIDDFPKGKLERFPEIFTAYFCTLIGQKFQHSEKNGGFKIF